MKANIIFAVFLFIGQNVGESSAEIKRSTSFDMLEEQLTAHTWSENQKCSEEILKTIHNVANKTLWASWIWDSIQLPVGQLYGSKYHFGNYDQCLRETIGSSKPPFRTQYCVADIVLGSKDQFNLSPDDIDAYASTEEYIRTKSKMKLSFNVITWGVCVPASCKVESVKTFLSSLLKQSHLGHLQSPIDITVTHCDVAGEKEKHIDGFHIVLVAASLIIVVILLCTKYVSRNQNMDSNTLRGKVIKCFCLKRNTQEWLQRQKNDIQVLYGIRFIASCLIMCLHIIFVPIVISTGNGFDFDETINRYQPLMSALALVVDTFFVLSGLLQVRNIKPNTTLWDCLQLSIKRYFRLIWWYIATTLMIFFIVPRSSCGPLCSRFMAPEYEHCVNGWWVGMLMLGNYIREAHICNVVVWYIFCDFHLTVMATILLWLHQKNARAAFVCFFVIAALSILLPASVVYQIPDLINLQIDFEAYSSMRNGTITPSLKIYQRTHHRAIPYIVGMIMGYIMSNYRPGSLKISFTKKQLLLTILTVIPMGVLLVLFFNENLKAAMLIVTIRLVWACLNCVLIVVSEYEYLPCLKKILSWSLFVPLSKLTYGVYMIHSITISYTWCSSRSPPYTNGYILTEKYLGNLLLANLLSLFFLLFVESPLNNLVKLLCTFGFKTKTKIEVASNGEIKSNGVLLSDKRTTELLEYKEKSQ